MNHINRKLAMTGIFSPIVGLLCLMGLSYIEKIMRYLLARPALLDDAAMRADALLPFFSVAYIFFCWTIIIPVVYALTELPVIKHRRPVIVLMITLPSWILGVVVLHQPLLDALWVSVSVVGLIVALPIFCSSWVASSFMLPANQLESEA